MLAVAVIKAGCETAGYPMFDTCMVGQRRVVGFLKRLVQTERIPHALLFAGPDGTGKVAAALEMVRTLHCEGGAEGACDACGSCRKTGALNHPDLSLLFPRSSRTSEDAERGILQEVMQDPYGYPLPEPTTTLSIDRIRDLQKRFAYGTFEGAWRTAVILHADHMRDQAANALLKTLEEPPDGSLLILIAPSSDALLPTLVSRCQVLRFSPLSSQDVVEALMEQASVEADRAWFIARASGGSLRRAREMADTEVEDVQDRAYRFLEALVWGEEFKTYSALEKLASDREGTLRVLGGTEIWLRDVLIYHHGDTDRVSHRTRLQDIHRLSGAFDLERLHQTVRKVEAFREMNTRNVNLHLGLVSLWRQVRGYVEPAAAGKGAEDALRGPGERG